MEQASRVLPNEQCLTEVVLYELGSVLNSVKPGGHAWSIPLYVYSRWLRRRSEHVLDHLHCHHSVGDSGMLLLRVLCTFLSL